MEHRTRFPLCVFAGREIHMAFFRCLWYNPIINREVCIVGLFTYDDAFVTFGSTPVANQFILEYLPKAKGDHVRVYLYGLMQCIYHRDDQLTVEQMARDLEMTEKDVKAAYRHWERCGLVSRISDNPEKYRYLSDFQVLSAENGPTVDQDYVRFTEDLYAAFGNERKLTGAEISQCYEWVTDMGLSPEAVMMIVRHMIVTRGKHFSVKSAEKTAVHMAEEGITDLEGAERFLARDKVVREGTKRILLRMGKHRLPSDDEMDLYVKWTGEWGFSQEQIEAACVKTVSGDPSMAYLNGILESMLHRMKADSAADDPEKAARKRDDDRQALKELLYLMNSRATVNEVTLEQYASMSLLYPKSVIMMAGTECAKSGGRLDDVLKLLESWKKKKLETDEDIRRYIRHFREQNQRMAELNEIWGTKQRVSQTDRETLDKWLDTWKLDWRLICACAPWAAEAEKPLLYLDRILENMKNAGVTDAEEARILHEQRPAQGKQNGTRKEKTVLEQQYHQREITEEIDTADHLVEQWQKEHPDE